MKTHKIPRLLVIILLASAPAMAQTATAPVEKRELIYCADLMTPEEREAYRASLRAARTPEAQEALRVAHRQEMQARAAKQGAADGCEPAGRQWRGGRAK